MKLRKLRLYLVTVVYNSTGLSSFNRENTFIADDTIHAIELFKSANPHIGESNIKTITVNRLDDVHLDMELFRNVSE